MSGDSTCLFVSPVVPAPTGGGVQMRAYWVLRALAARHRVVLVTGSLSHRARSTGAVRPLCDQLISLDLGRDPSLLPWRIVRRVSDRLFVRLLRAPRDLVPLTAWGARRLSAALAGRSVDLVHCFRLCTMPVALHLLEATGAPASQLDLDDIESRTRRRIAALHRERGELDQARAMATEAALCEGLERRAARRFDRLLVCSTADEAALAAMGLGCPVAVVPNVVPRANARVRAPGACFELLVVGSYGYLPNREGVEHFCRQVLPRLRRRSVRPVRLRVVGRGLTRGLRRVLASSDGVEVVGAVSDLAPCYARADAVVAPIRAGGGTRIKILEAFAHGRPVVSTTVGAEGLGVGDGEQLLLADSPEDFVRQCLRLVDQPDLGRRLAASAQAFVREHHAPERLLSALGWAGAARVSCT